MCFPSRQKRFCVKSLEELLLALGRAPPQHRPKHGPGTDLGTDQGTDLSTDQGTDLGTDFVVFEIFMFFKPQKPEGIHLWK